MIRSSIDVPKGDAKRGRHGVMDDLIWMEILCRLPATKSVFRCRCVSKHWNSLISHEYFIINFINYHLEKYGSNSDKDQLLLFVDYYTREEGILATGFLSYQGVTQGRMFPEISLLEFPYPTQNLKVVSRWILPPYKPTHPTCNFRCGTLSNKAIEFRARSMIYCCALITRRSQMFITSSTLSSKSASNLFGFRHVGFVCEPFCTRGQFGVNVNYRYRVVSIVNFDKLGGCSVEMYSSETRRWSVQTSVERKDYKCDSNVMAHNGKVYWYNRQGGIVVVYDPFDTNGESSFHFYGVDTTWCFGTIFQLIESQGSILLANLEKVPFKMSIWKLKENGNDDDYGTWCFERSIIATDIISSSNATPGFLQYPSRGLSSSRPLILGIHPSNSDVIFLTNAGSLHVASYNLVTKEWQVLGEVQHSYGIDFFHYDQLYVPATLPWWPTPVH